MIRRIRNSATMLGLVAAIACGGSDAQRQAEEAAAEAQKAADALTEAANKAADGSAESAEDFASAMQGMASALSGAAAAANGGKAVDPVSFRDLQALLPSVDGWTMDKPSGERMTAPIPYSETEADYVNGDDRVSVKIVDSGFNQMLIAPWSMFLSAGFERETEDGYEKAVDIDGTPGFEKWNTNDNSGELNLFVAKRFLVTIEADQLSGPEALRSFASALDTSKLAALK